MKATLTSGIHVSKRSDSGIYQAHINGQRVSLGTRDKAEAIEKAKLAKLPQLAALSKAEALTAQAVSVLMQKRRTAMDTLVEWESLRMANGRSTLTIARDTGIVRQFLRVTRTETADPNAIGEREVDAFINAATQIGVSARHRMLAALRTFFSFCQNSGASLGNPAASVEVNFAKLSHEQKESTHHVPFTEEQYRTLIGSEHLTGWWPHAVRISYASGLRLADVAQLERASVGADFLVVWTAKGRRRVQLPFDEQVTPELRKTLAALPQNSSPFFFPAEREISSHPTRRSLLPVSFGRILKRVGIEGLSFHSLRSTCARRWRSLGFDLDTCRDFLGHRSTTTTSIYTGESND